MARPAKFDRKTAINVAMNAMWRDGFDRSSVKQLSELLGMTRSSFYNAFGSQEDLFRACLPEYGSVSPDAALYGEVVGDVLPLLSGVFRSICRSRASDPESRGCLVINTVTDLCPSEDGLGAELSELVLGSAQRLETLLTIAQENGEIDAHADTHALSLALQNLMVGINIMCKVVREETELWLLTRTTLQGLGLYREQADA